MHNRPILFMHNRRIWANRNSLKGTKVWVKEDFPAEIEKRRTKLQPYLRAARAGNPNQPDQRITAHMREDKLFINSQMYTTDTLDSIPAFVKAQADNLRQQHELDRAFKQTDSVTLFFTKASPLSNFHPSQFEFDGRIYNCAEQYIAYEKALLFGEPDIAAEILRERDPRIQKRKATNLPNFAETQWKDHATAILKPVLTAKFMQNEQLKAFLLSTGDNVIGEASPSDQLFGIGLSLNNPSAVDNSLWCGGNLQGSTLMEVRDELK